MDYPPNDDNQSQYTPPQPNTSYPPQQPGASYPLPQPPYPYQPPPPPVPPKKGTSPALWVAIGVIVVLFLCIFSSSLHTGSQNAATDTTTTTQDTPQPTDTSQPTDTPVPTISPAQTEKQYKALTTSTTIESLDKNGSSWQGKDVHFTCTILDFVKDSSGNTAGANVDDPNTSGVVQVIFPSNTDLSRLNT